MIIEMDKTPLYQKSYELLVEMILEGKFKSGEKLTDKGLSEMLNISRTPVREAVRQLVKDGLLTSLPNKGVTILMPTLKDLAEIYMIRSAMEGLAARLAFLNPNKKEYLEKMEIILKESRLAIMEADTLQMTKLNTQFHSLIIQASNHFYLQSLSQTIHNKMIMCRMHSLKKESNMHIALDEHYEILYNISSTNEEKVENTMRNHIYQAGSRIIEQSDEKLDESDPVFMLYMNHLNTHKI